MIERVTFYQIYFNNKKYPSRLEFVSKDIPDEVDKIISVMEQNNGQLVLNKEELKKIIIANIETGASNIDLLVTFENQELPIKVQIKTMY